MVYDTQSYISPSNSSNLDQDTEVNKPKTPHIISFLSVLTVHVLQVYSTSISLLKNITNYILFILLSV